MTNELIHFPIYIGDALKRFIEFPTLEERGAWISFVIAMVHNDGEFESEEELFNHCLVFDEKNKQCLSKTLAKLKQKNIPDDIKLLIDKQKSLREARKKAGKKGGKISKKNKQSLSISESESELELELESESKKRHDSDESKIVSNSKDYAFFGSVIRLTEKDYQSWVKEYHPLPEDKIHDELLKADEYYSERPPPGGKWFYPVKTWMKKARTQYKQQKYGSLL